MSRHSLLALFAALAVALMAAVVGAATTPTQTTSRSYDAQVARVASGTITLDISNHDFTAWTNVLTITPASGQALYDVFVVIDLADATTGFAAVHTSETITFAPAHLVDSFNRDAEKTTTAISGTNAATSQVSMTIPYVPPGGLKVWVKLSAEAGDTTLPFTVSYRAPSPATISAEDS